MLNLFIKWVFCKTVNSSLRHSLHFSCTVWEKLTCLLRNTFVITFIYSLKHSWLCWQLQPQVAEVQQNYSADAIVCTQTQSCSHCSLKIWLSAEAAGVIWGLKPAVDGNNMRGREERVRAKGNAREGRWEANFKFSSCERKNFFLFAVLVDGWIHGWMDDISTVMQRGEQQLSS